ncbi:MAG: TetR/AcrR family transcriptional regulator C-terminal domain-containing protein, partial [Pseudomonadota bacterium]
EGPLRAREIVRAELVRAHAAGDIVADDPDALAELLCDMVYPSPLERLLEPEAVPPSEAEANARLDLAIRVFLGGVSNAPPSGLSFGT